MSMKDALAELRSFKATITPAATTGAAHPGKRARVQQDRLPEIALFRGTALSFRYFQFRGEGETVRELSVARAKQEPSKSLKSESECESLKSESECESLKSESECECLKSESESESLKSESECESLKSESESESLKSESEIDSLKSDAEEILKSKNSNKTAFMTGFVADDQGEE
jgi:hypothetical protein